MSSRQLNMVVRAARQCHYLKIVTGIYHVPAWNTLCVHYKVYQPGPVALPFSDVRSPAPPVTCLTCLALDTGRYVDLWGHSHTVQSFLLFEGTEVFR